MGPAPRGRVGEGMADQQEARDRLLGILLVVVSSCFFGSVDAFSKLLADTQSVGQIVWGRYALGLLVLLVTRRPSELATLFQTRRLKLQILRGLTPLTVSVTMVLAVRYLPLAEATVVLYTGPFLVVALSVPVLRERVGAASWLGVIVGFIAVLIVARPGLSALSKFTTFPLIAAIFFAILQLITRTLSAAGERPYTTLAWTLLVGCIVSTPLAVLTWEPLSARAWAYMGGLGIVFSISQLMMIRAFVHAPAGLLAPFTYIQIISATVLGILVFGDIPDLWNSRRDRHDHQCRRLRHAQAHGLIASRRERKGCGLSFAGAV